MNASPLHEHIRITALRHDIRPSVSIVFVAHHWGKATNLWTYLRSRSGVWRGMGGILRHHRGSRASTLAVWIIPIDLAGNLTQFPQWRCVRVFMALSIPLQREYNWVPHVWSVPLCCFMSSRHGTHLQPSKEWGAWIWLWLGNHEVFSGDSVTSVALPVSVFCSVEPKISS